MKRQAGGNKSEKKKPKKSKADEEHGDFEKDSKRKRDQIPLEILSYDKIKISHLAFRIVFITRDLNSVSIEFCLKYRDDVEKILQEAADRAASHRGENRSVSEIIGKYEKGGDEKVEVDKNDPTFRGFESDDDDDDNDEDADDEDSDEGKSMEASDDDERGDAKKGKKVKVARFRSFVNIHKLPLINPYAAYTCVLKEGTRTYPPGFDDVDIVKVTNLYKPVLLKSVVDKTKKLAYWMGDISAIKRDIEFSASKKQFLRREDLLRYMQTAEHQNMVVTLYRDVFRSWEFYWFIGLVPNFRVTHLTDEYCKRAYADIRGDQFINYLFAEETMPLLFVDNMQRREELDPHIDLEHDDIATYLAAFERPITEVPLRVTAATKLANAVWHFWWVRVGLYKGRFCWTTNKWDLPLDLSEQDVKVAIGYLLSRHQIVRINNATYVPAFAIIHWTCFHRLNVRDPTKRCRIEFSCYNGSVDNILAFVTSLGDGPTEEKLIVCPTLQSYYYTRKATGITACVMGPGFTEKSLQDVDTIILNEMHNMSTKQLFDSLGLIIRTHVATKRTMPYKVVFCGISTKVILSEAQGRSCMFEHFLESTNRNHVIYGTDNVLVSEDLLLSSVDKPVKFGEAIPITIQTTVIPATDRNNHNNHNNVGVYDNDGDGNEDGGGGNDDKETRKGELDRYTVDDMAGYIQCAVDHERVKATDIPFLVFENKIHMQQITNHQRLAAAFPTSIFFVSQFVRETDGGIRRIAELWLRRPGGGGEEKVQSINMTETQPELVVYRLDSDGKKTSRSLSERPLVPVYYAHIEALRCGPIPDADICAVFTDKRRRFSERDFNKLVYISRRRLLVLVMQKAAGFQFSSNFSSFEGNVNLFDLVAK